MLGSANLDSYVMPNGQFDLDRLDQDTRIIIRYLDDVLEEGLALLWKSKKKLFQNTDSSEWELWASRTL